MATNLTMPIPPKAWNFAIRPSELVSYLRFLCVGCEPCFLWLNVHNAVPPRSMLNRALCHACKEEREDIKKFQSVIWQICNHCHNWVFIVCWFCSLLLFFLNARQIGWSAIAIGGNKQYQSKIRQSRHNSSPGFFVRGKGIIISSLANGILFSILRNFATMSFPTENGDWICNCGVMNFKSRSACRMCSV